MSKEKVTVLGFYGHQNCGDEAYRLAFPKIFPGVDFTFTDVLPEKCTNPVILGGGNVMQEFFLEQLKKCPMPKYAMSVNLACRDTRYHDLFEHIFVRNLCPGTDKVSYVPDFAFALESNPTRGKTLIKSLFNKTDLYEKVGVVVLNAYLCSGEASLARDHVTFDKVCYDLAKVMDTTSASFILLPFGGGAPYNDRLALSALYSRCKFWRKNCLIYNDIFVQDTLDIVSAADLLIGTRLHASIFACVGGTPFIDLTHHDKTAYFLESVNRPWGVNYWTLNVERLRELIAEFLAPNNYRTELSALATKNRQLLLEIPKNFGFTI